MLRHLHIHLFTDVGNITCKNNVMSKYEKLCHAKFEKSYLPFKNTWKYERKTILYV